MPLSKPVKPCHLVPGKKYFIDIYWNLTNDLRFPTSNYTKGTYVETNYINGKRGNYNSGLQILLKKSRYESVFLVEGKKQKVSSTNTFYEILKPPEDEIKQISTLFSLRLPNDIKKYITTYTDYIMKLKYYSKKKL
jgi:hypothetical protein